MTVTNGGVAQPNIAERVIMEINAKGGTIEKRGTIESIKVPLITKPRMVGGSECQEDTVKPPSQSSIAIEFDLPAIASANEFVLLVDSDEDYVADDALTVRLRWRDKLIEPKVN